jgi:uncharacterized caspase-like protein
MRYVVILFVLLSTISTNAFAQVGSQSLALVIGNGAYRSVAPLANPINDAQTAKETFEGLGFEVMLVLDTDASELRAALTKFEIASAGADVAIIYYAGHGIQAQNENYLLMVESDGTSLRDAIRTSIKLDELIAAFAETARTKLLFVDACRNNPFTEATRAIGASTGGLARVGHERSDLMVVYAAQPNRVALDGAEGNSPFMTAIADTFSKSPVPPLQDALIDITKHVQTTTSGQQTPYIEGSLSFRITFGEKDRADAASVAPEQCTGTMKDISLSAPEAFISLTGAEAHLRFGELLHVCPSVTGVHIDGPTCWMSLRTDPALSPRSDPPGRYVC